MNDNPAMSRARYLRTLHRFCGPYMGFRISNYANTNSRASLPCAAGSAGYPPGLPPQTFNKPIHAALIAGEAQ